MSKSRSSVSLKTYFSYGSVALPMALFAITFYVYIPKFYTDSVGLALSVVAHIVLLSRIADAVLDPLMGGISDRTRSKLGRRKPWILVSFVPLVISFIFLLYPSIHPSIVREATWFGIWTVAFFIFWTMLSIPYEAFGAEISFDYHERTKLLGFRDGALVLGTLLAAVCPVIYEKLYPGDVTETKWMTLGVLYSIVLIAAVLNCVRHVPERHWDESLRPKGSMLRNLSHVVQNRPFLILLVSYTIGAFGAQLPATLFLYYVQYVLNGSELEANGFLVLYFLVGFLCLPFWIWLAGRMGKKEAWICAMLVNTGAFAGVFFLTTGDLFLYGILVALSAVGYGATLALPSSMQADVIDYDELRHGTRKEGQFIGLWSISKKCSAAVGAGIALEVLNFFGYRPNEVQTPETIFALRFLYAGVPCLCNFIAMVIAWRYPISQRMYLEIRKKIDDRTAGLAGEAAAA